MTGAPRAAAVARTWPLVAVTSTGTFLGAFDFTVVNVAFPDLQRAFAGASLADLSWVLNAYAIAFAAALLPAGGLADLLGRRRVFLSGLALFTAASGACALAPSVGVLVAARVVQAVGGGVLTPTALALLAARVDPKRRAVAIGLWSATGSIAAAAGPAAGGALVEAGGWRLVFLVAVPFGALAVAAGIALVPDDRPEPAEPRTGPPDVAAVPLLAGAVALLALAIVKSPAWGWAAAPTVAAVAGAGALGAWFAHRSGSHPRPVVDLDVLRARASALAAAAMLAFGVVLFAMLLCAVLFLERAWGYPSDLVGLAVTPGPVAAAIVSVVGGRVTARAGHRAAGAGALLVMAAGAGALAASTGARPDYVADFLPGLLLLEAGGGLAFTALNVAAVTAVPPERLGVASATAATARAIGSVLGISLLVVIVGAPGASSGATPFHAAWAGMAVVAVAAAALVAAQPETSVASS
ncbi:MAG TPA: MFS transporter [Actinomycetota bacterium]|nr:MFS transporter [Actinomycetota bacterium]